MKNTKSITFADLALSANSSMLTLPILLLLVITSFTASAQKSTVVAAFSKHGIDAGILNAESLQRPSNYAFDFKQTTVAAGKETVTVAKFDPSSPKEEQWTVVSINGKSPSKSEVNTFRKNQNAEKSANKADDSSYKIEKETSDNLVISYKPDPTSIAKDAGFMKDCRLFMTVNLKTKKLEKEEVINEKPVKIKMLSADKFNLTMKYNWNEAEKRYLSGNEELNMDAKFLGQAISMQTITEYTNYAKK